MTAKQKHYDEDGYRLTDCCGAMSTYYDADLVCKKCYKSVGCGQGDGTETRDGKVDGPIKHIFNVSDWLKKQ